MSGKQSRDGLVLNYHISTNHPIIQVFISTLPRSVSSPGFNTDYHLLDKNIISLISCPRGKVVLK